MLQASAPAGSWPRRQITHASPAPPRWSPHLLPDVPQHPHEWRANAN